MSISCQPNKFLFSVSPSADKKEFPPQCNLDLLVWFGFVLFNDTWSQ